MPTPTPTSSPTPTGDGILRIGTLFPASGPLAGFSAAQVAGVNAAVREINTAGGVLGAPVEIVNRDAGADGSGTAGPSFDDLVAHGVDVVIGPSSSATAQELLPAATVASVPVISPSASGAVTDDAGWFFRLAPTDADEGDALARLLVAAGASHIALVHLGEEPGAATSDALAAGLEAQDAELVADVPGEGDAAAAVEQVSAADPDAVVLAAPDGGEPTMALISALTAAGLGGDTLWLTGALAAYGAALPTGTLTGVTAVVPGFSPDDALRARFLLEDPGLRNLRFAAEAYDATILAALEATLAGDDGGASIDRMLPAAAAGGIPCTSFGECLDVLSTQDDIDYQGMTGPVDLDENGDLMHPGFALYGYTPENTLAFAEWTTG